MLNKNNLPLLACGLAFVATCVVAYWYMHISADTLYLPILGQSMVQFGPAELSNWTQLYRVFPTIIVMYLSSFIFDSPLPKLWLAFIVQAVFMVAGILFLLKVLLRERMDKNTVALVLLLCSIPIYLQFHQHLAAYDTLGNSGHFGAYVLIPPIFGCVINFLRGGPKLYIFTAGIMCFLAIVSSIAFVPFGIIPLLAYLFVVSFRQIQIRKVFWAGTICLSCFALGMWLVKSSNFFLPSVSSRSLTSLLAPASWYIETVAAIPRLMDGIALFIICLLSLFIVAMVAYLVRSITLNISDQRVTIITTDWNIIALFYVLTFILVMTFLGPILGNVLYSRDINPGLHNLRFVHPLSMILGIGFVYAINKLEIPCGFFSALLLSGGIVLLALDYSSYAQRRLKVIPASHPSYFIEELRREGIPLQNGFAQYWDAAATAAFLQDTRILAWRTSLLADIWVTNDWKRPYTNSENIYNFVLYNTARQPKTSLTVDLPEGYTTYKNDKFPHYIIYYYPGSQLDFAFNKIYQSTLARWSAANPFASLVFWAESLPSQTGHKYYDGRGYVADEAAGDKAGHLTFGPYITMAPGTYDVSVKYSGTTSDGTPVGWWDMRSSSENIKFFTADLLPTSNEEMTDQKRVVLECKTPFVEVRTYFNGKGRLQVESITITPVDKKHPGKGD